MIEYYKRCKHCNKIYLYQASGHGCDRPENHRDYCPECAMAVYNALNSIPVTIVEKYKEMPVDEEFIAKLMKIKEDNAKKREEKGYLNVQCIKFTGVPIKQADVFIVNRRTYATGKDQDGNTKLFMLYEYDKVKQEYIGEWENIECSKEYTSCWQEANIMITWQEKFKDVEFQPVQPLAPPTGKLFFGCEQYLNESGNHENFLNDFDRDSSKLTWMTDFSMKTSEDIKTSDWINNERNNPKV